jgi:hypothetical protein
MPWIFHAIGDFLSATYFIELERAIILRGAGFEDLGRHLIMLGAMGAGCSLCALFDLRRAWREAGELPPSQDSGPGFQI